MLTLHRIFIKTALLYLLSGFLLGALLLLGKGGWFVPTLPEVYVTLHTHLIAVGFFLMLVMGVAYWMFPRLPGTTPQMAARDPLAWVSYVLLNGGLLLRVVFEPMLPAPAARPAMLISAIAQVGAVLFFLLAIWRRIRMPRIGQP